jgi:hypothetical protein
MLSQLFPALFMGSESWDGLSGNGTSRFRFQEDRRQEEAITAEYYKSYAERVGSQTKGNGTAREIRPSSAGSVRRQA